MISILIINFNDGKYIKDCLEAISKLNYENYEIIVVDNGSVDDSLRIVKKFPRVKLIELGKNYGIPAYNFGIKEARGEYLFFLGSHVIVDKNVLNVLLDVLKKEEVGGVGCKLFDLRNKDIIKNMGFKVNLLNGKVKMFNYNEKDCEEFDDDVDVMCIGSGNFLVKKKVLDEVGCFDERFFLGDGDADLCLRIRKKGYKLKVVPKAKIYEEFGKHEGKRPFRVFHEIRGKVLLMRKHSKNFFVFLVIFSFYSFFKLVYYGFKLRFDIIGAYIRGFFSGLGNKQMIYTPGVKDY